MGRLDVDALLAELSGAQLAEWRAADRLDPWGEERADLRAGIIAAEIANAAGRNEPAVPADFMPYLERPHPAEPDQRELKRALEQAFSG